MGDGKLIEISIPIFLRPLMREILSIGKSLKIIRYLEAKEKTKLFEELVDFKKLFKQKLQEHRLALHSTDHLLDKEIKSCASANLNVAWTTKHTVSNMMTESAEVKNMR